MLDREPRTYVDLPRDGRPALVVVVDTEEEFDWAKPLSRDNRSVTSIAAQPRAHEIFSTFGIVPTYVIDHPVAADRDAVAVLRGLAESGDCEIGAHLHPWVNPPDDEEVCPRFSYPGNLDPALERAKLAILTDRIAEGFGARPFIYKAGRYGVGANTADTLRALGYRIDVSVVPFTSFAADGGPDFSDFGYRPYWHGNDRDLLEIPLTCGFCGALRAWGQSLFPYLVGGIGRRFRLPGIHARLGLLERIRLTPEGTTLDDQRRLTRSLIDQGCRLFAYTYHSPSLAAGHTPYVQRGSDLAAFLDTMAGYFALFRDEFGGEFLSVSQAATAIERQSS